MSGETRRLGDLRVSAIGMGAMTLTQTIDSDPGRGADAVRAALEAGVTLFDTADSYGATGIPGENERALVDAIRSVPGAIDRVIISTKGGHTRGENASWWIDGTPEHLARAARASALRLGVEALPLYHHHRPDPRTPYAESMGALRQLVDEGVVVRVGVSNVNREQLRTAHAVLGRALVSVQNELSPVASDPQGIVELSGELGLAFLAWGPLGGMREAKNLGGTAAAFDLVARDHGVSPQRVALAWLLARAPHIIPIPGASRAGSILDSVEATRLRLSDDERRALDGSVQ